MRYKNNKLTLPKEIYAAQLKNINTVALSQREIDIIACILSGRSAKGIANFLSISYKTVQVHALNAMKKLGCTSRESMIALVEKSDQFIPLKEYYSSLLTYSTFEKCLKEVAKLGSGSKCTCMITYWKIIDSPFFHHLKDHLTLAGVSALLEVREKKQPFSQLLQEARYDIYTLYALPHAWVGRFQTESNEDLRQLSQESPEYQRNILFLLWETEKLIEIPQEIKRFDYLDITQQKNYYFSVFAILEKVLPNLELDAIFAQFEKAAAQHNPSIHVPPPIPAADRLEEVDKKKEERVLATIKVLVPKKLGYVLAGTLSVGLLFLLILNQNHTTTSRDKKSNSIHYQNESLAREDLLDHSVQSDLVIPAAPILLNRLELINQINDQFKQQTGQIRTVVLLGMGGSGKTTLARQYALSKKTPVVWEINADTQSSLVESLENLAYVLSQTVEDKKALRGLTDIRNPKEREEKILFFLKERLKSYSNWFLIFDNVEKFSDIQKYFPFDSTIWGKGEILVTTQNENIPNNRHFSYMVKVGELSPEEKLALFTKIMSNSDASSLTADQKEQIQRLLNEISSFPLDVSVAAHYLKVTNINYLKYLDNINKYKNDFDNLQSNILKEVGNYTKTRYGIITLSLKKIIDESKNFEDLFLFISLLDAQNIPRGLLEGYKDTVVVDNFIYCLKKYSLIIDDPLSPLHLDSSYSIHRSTQSIILAYLTKTLNLKNNSPELNLICDTLEKYSTNVADEENLPKMKILQKHYEKFISYKDILTPKIEGIIGSELGYIYWNLGNYIKSRDIAEKSLEYLSKIHNENGVIIARTLTLLGNVYRELEDFEKAKDFLEQSLIMHKKYYSENSVKFAEVLTYLGNTYAYLRSHDKAIHCFEESIAIYSKNNVHNHIKVARTLTHLGYIHRWLGNYEKSKSFLEQSLLIYKQQYSENHVKFVQVLAYIGLVYKSLGNYQKARDLVEKALFIYKKNYDQNHVDIAWSLSHLGDIYAHLGDYQKAKNLLEQSLLIYQRNPFKTIRIALAQRYLGNLYGKLGDYEKAKKLLEQSLIFYKKKNNQENTEVGTVFRDLGKIYLMEGQLETAENLINKSLQIFQQNMHPERHKSLEALAELYLSRSNSLKAQGEPLQAQMLKEQAINYLNQSLEVLKTSLPSDSPHIERIQSQINSIKSAT